MVHRAVSRGLKNIILGRITAVATLSALDCEPVLNAVNHQQFVDYFGDYLFV